MDSHFPCVLTSSGTLESLNLSDETPFDTNILKHVKQSQYLQEHCSFSRTLVKKITLLERIHKPWCGVLIQGFFFFFFYMQALTDGLYSEGSLWLKYKSFGSSSQIGVWVKRRETEGRLGFHASSPTSHIRNAYPINFTTNELIYLIFMDFICKVQTYYFSAD